MKSRKGETFEFKCSAPVKRGEVVIINKLIGVAAVDGAAQETITAYAEGVYELKKATGVINQGAEVYWDESEKNVTTVNSENTLIGLAWETTISSAPTVMVKIN